MENNKIFMWIFDYYTFETKDIVEIADYTLTMDEETNAKSTINVLKKTTAKARDIIAVKQNNQVIYWGVIDEIQNEDGKQLYTYSTKYITNLFNRKIALKTTGRIIYDGDVPDGLYVFTSNADYTKAIGIHNGSILNGANAELLTFNESNKHQYWGVSKQSNGHYMIINAKSGRYLTKTNLSTGDVAQYNNLTSNRQFWDIVRTGTGAYVFKCVNDNTYITINSSNYLVSTTTNISEATRFTPRGQTDEKYMQYVGVEDMIKSVIESNFTKSDDTFINLPWLEIEVLSHTPVQVSVSNVNNGIYNLHTWINNCMQNYNIVYTFRISGTKVIMSIEKQYPTQKLIDTKAQSISNYNEVFETDIVSKVVVLYSKVNGVDNPGTYTLYLLNDRTTTTNGNNVNRADGKVETIYTENYEDANQEALNIMKSNSYNHNITFNLYNKYIPIGTPIAIKTKESLIYDSYISSVKISHNKAYEYICGNIRIKFIEKLLKERN